MMRKMFEHMKKQCEENGSECPPWMKGNCDWKKKNCNWGEWKKCWKNSCEKRCKPEDRRDPARACFDQKKAEFKNKKAEVREQAKELGEKKKEMKILKKEMKKLKKECKKSLRKEKYAAQVVSHLDSDETSTQKPGTCVLHQWKVKNVGTKTWFGDVLATFAKGNRSILAEGFDTLQVGEVQPGHVCYLPAMFDVPSLPGTYTAVFRMTTAEGMRFGEPLRVVIEVEDQEPPKSEEAKEMPTSPQPFSSVPGSNIPKSIDIDDIPEKESTVFEEETVEAVPEEAFDYAVELQMLKDMGLENDEETMKSVLVAVQGDIAQAIEMLF